MRYHLRKVSEFAMNKRMWCFVFAIFAMSILKWPIDDIEKTDQVIIHFTQTPAGQQHHQNLNNIIEESVEHINARLIADGLIAPELRMPLADAPFTDRLVYHLKNNFYRSFYPLTSQNYPHRENRAFFTRINPTLGIYAIHVPHGVSTPVFIKYLRDIYARNGIEFHIDRDPSVRIAVNQSMGLEGIYFNAEELLRVQQGRLPERIKTVLAQRHLPDSALFDAFLWHLSFPTVGITLKEPFYPPPYPFLPHYFSLWQLAPKQGNGVRIGVIDTGIAAYQVADNTRYLKNESLQPTMLPGKHNFNIVSSYGLDPLEQFINTIKTYVDPAKYDEEYLETVAPEWIKEYLIDKNDRLLRQYLIDMAKPAYTSGTQLTERGQEALQNLLTSNQGIKPIDTAITPPFTIGKLIKPIETDVVLEFLPAPHITGQPVTFVAGHGTHTFGLVSAQNIGNGITGIAPQATTFMIKGFKDDGSSDQSTLIAALKKAIAHDADVVNLSLKIADDIDFADSTAQLLERTVNLIPYVIAASGNEGDPARTGITKPIESYPARFASVPFDVGAFGYDSKTAYIPAFSQYEPAIGPLFVAPGFDILSTAIVPNQTVDSMYMFLAGTSMAAPLMTGFVALMLAEFKDIFSREQLLKVTYLATLRLQDTDDWKRKVLLGALDMRTALLMLYILADIKQNMMKADFDQKFDQSLAAVEYLLFAAVDEYSSKYLNNISFRNNYIGYLNAAVAHKDVLQKEHYFVPSSVDDAVRHIADIIKVALDSTAAPDARSKKVQEILQQPAVDLFGDLAEAVQKRITAKETADDYWINQAQQLKNLYY